MQHGLLTINSYSGITSALSIHRIGKNGGRNSYTLTRCDNKWFTKLYIVVFLHLTCFSVHIYWAYLGRCDHMCCLEAADEPNSLIRSLKTQSFTFKVAACTLSDSLTVVAGEKQKYVFLSGEFVNCRHWHQLDVRSVRGLRRVNRVRRWVHWPRHGLAERAPPPPLRRPPTL